MWTIQRIRALLLVAIATGAAGVEAAEPNETFSSPTILAPGVRSVSDSLTPGAMVGQPDTLLGVRGAGGAIVAIDDNSSPVGNGKASGVTNAPTVAGAVNVAVTGVGDNSFAGSHTQQGDYEVFFLIYNAAHSLIDLFTSPRTMQPGVVQEFSYSKPTWVGGTFDAYIDNRVGPITGGDVDFFTFTDLTPGASFTAETLADHSSTLDTVLGWFGGDGVVRAFNDDKATGLLSEVEGAVPANGQVTLAVSGYGDDNFAGAHTENAPYQLRLTVSGGTTLAADFNDDGRVDAADLAAWRTSFAVSAAADADSDNDSDGADLLVWQRQLGAGAVSAMASALPEPAAVILVAPAIAVLARRRAVQRQFVRSSLS